MAVIKVPKTPRRAFDKNRRVSALLRGQLAHLEWAARPASQRKPEMLPRVDVKTEGEAAERIAALTAVVIAQSRSPLTTEPLVPAAPAVAVPGRKVKKRRAPRKRGAAARKKTRSSRSTRSRSSRSSRGRRG